jgi:hypothetical protein
MHEDMRAKPASWTVVGWMPVLDEEKSDRPSTQGYECNAARNMRLHHQCWTRFLSLWPDHSEHARVVIYGDGKARSTRHFLGALLGDMQVDILHIMHIYHIYRIKHICHIQEFDKWTCEPHPSCHRCPAGILEFLRTDLPFAAKTMRTRQEEITFEASGDGLRERAHRGVVEGSVVEWDEDGSNVRPGPNAAMYESVRKECGAHPIFNAFWKVKNFCVQQMLPRDGMHAFDLGALIRLIIAILLKYFHCAEDEMDMEGLAAARMEARMRMYLARREGPDGQM